MEDQKNNIPNRFRDTVMAKKVEKISVVELLNTIAVSPFLAMTVDFWPRDKLCFHVVLNMAKLFSFSFFF